MAITETEKEKLRLKLIKELGSNFDLFDFDAELDSSLSYEENENIIYEKIEPMLKKIMTAKQYKNILENKSFCTSEFIIGTDKDLLKIFDKPKIIGIVGDVNKGKSMLIYNLLHLIKDYNFNLYCYGLRVNLKKAINIYSVSELERIKNSVIIIDELSSLFDLDNRKVKSQIENTLRLINHNNNILILSGTPENYKKFISAKIDYFLFKNITLADCINGSRTKNILMQYKGVEMGTEIFDLPVDKALFYDGQHYKTIDIKYLPVYDTKKSNCKIIENKFY